MSGIISAVRLCFDNVSTSACGEGRSRERVFDEKVVLMILAGTLGALVGAMGFFPLLLVQHLAKRGSRRARSMSTQLGMIVIGAGFILFLVVLLVVAKLASEVFPAFGISMALAFLASSVVFALREQKR
jgi:hypothetical protein